jgi:hypothetical protein
MRRSSIRKMVVLGLCVFVGLFVPATIHGQENNKDKIKLTRAELQDRYSKYCVTAGVNKLNGCAWMVINFGDGKRKQYWHCPGGSFGSSEGTYRVVDDKLCNSWKEMMGGRE